MTVAKRKKNVNIPITNDYLSEDTYQMKVFWKQKLTIYPSLTGFSQPINVMA